MPINKGYSANSEQFMAVIILVHEAGFMHCNDWRLG